MPRDPNCSLYRTVLVATLRSKGLNAADVGNLYECYTSTVRGTPLTGAHRLRARRGEKLRRVQAASGYRAQMRGGQLRRPPARNETEEAAAKRRHTRRL